MDYFADNPDIVLKGKGEVGKLKASLYWKGKNRKTEGLEKILRIEEGKLIEIRLLILSPNKIDCLGYVAVKEINPETTKIVLGVRGSLRFPATVKSIFCSIQKGLNGNLEASLVRLKKIMENPK